MRILQLCNRVPFPLIDGGAIAMFAMTKSFAVAGCEVHTLAINTRKHFVNPAHLPVEFSNYTTLYTVDADTDVKVFPAFINLLAKASYNLARFDIPEFHERLKQLLQQNKYDVVQLEGLFLSPYLATIRKFSTALISMRGHNVEYLIWERMATASTSFFKKKYLNILAKRLKREEMDAIQKVDCIVPISIVDEKTYKLMGANVPMLVCTAGVDEELLFMKAVNREENTLFHLAAMNWQPNVQAVHWLMEKVLPIVKTKFPNLKVYLAGKDMPKVFFDMQNEQIHVQGRVDKAYDFMLSKDIMLVPLLAGSGMRIKIIEGLALGKVIISTSIGAEGIACTHKKDILIADTEEEFSAAIELALNDKLLCKELSKNAIDLVKSTYTNSTIVQNLLAFYKKQLSFRAKEEITVG